MARKIESKCYTKTGEDISRQRRKRLRNLIARCNELATLYDLDIAIMTMQRGKLQVCDFGETEAWSPVARALRAITPQPELKSSLDFPEVKKHIVRIDSGRGIKAGTTISRSGPREERPQPDAAEEFNSAVQPGSADDGEHDLESVRQALATECDEGDLTVPANISSKMMGLFWRQKT